MVAFWPGCKCVVLRGVVLHVVDFMEIFRSCLAGHFFNGPVPLTERTSGTEAQKYRAWLHYTARPLRERRATDARQWRGTIVLEGRPPRLIWPGGVGNPAEGATGPGADGEPRFAGARIDRAPKKVVAKIAHAAVRATTASYLKKVRRRLGRYLPGAPF